MADIPKHLLERAAARRAALSGEAAPTPSGPADAAVPASVPAVTGAAAAVAASAGGSGAGAPPPATTVPAVPAAPLPPPVPRGMGFARMGSVFTLVALPVWLFFMFNTFSVQGAAADTPEAVGGRLYAANCVACHGANGAGSAEGGVGRPLYNGEVDKSFPDPLDQFAFVRHGSCGVGVSYGNPKREGGQHVGKGGMPAFAAGTLSDAELIAIMNYERHILAGETYPVNELIKADEPEATRTSVVPPADLDAALKAVKITTDDVCEK